MCCFATVCFHHEKLKEILHEKCLFRAYPVFRDIPNDIMPLAQISHPWNSTEDTPEFTGNPPHIILMSELDIFKYEIESLKGKTINQLQYRIDKRGFSSAEHSTKTILDEMTSQTKQIME